MTKTTRALGLCLARLVLWLSPQGENREALRTCFTGYAVSLVGETFFHEYADV